VVCAAREILTRELLVTIGAEANLHTEVAQLVRVVTLSLDFR